MGITNRTLEDVIIQAFDSGRLVWVLVIGFIIGLILGIVLTNLYYSKFKNVQLNNKLVAEQEKCLHLQEEFNLLNKKYGELLSDVQIISGELYAHYATQEDESDKAVQSLLN